MPMPVSFTANTSVECLADDVTCALEDDPISGPLRKLGKTLGEFATYISNNAGYIVNYGERFRAGERISTGFVESAVNQIVDKRFDKRQSMRWTPRGAHLLFQTRTRVLNASTATSINSSVAVTQRSGNRQATTGRQRPCARFVMGSRFRGRQAALSATQRRLQASIFRQRLRWDMPAAGSVAKFSIGRVPSSERMR
jgi:hypothetical protein